MTLERVWSMALAMDGVEDSTYYGLQALKVNGRMVACVAGHPIDDVETLVIPVPFERRNELLASDPETFYTTDHYVNYPCVLVRLPSVDTTIVRELLTASCRAAAAAPPPRTRARKARRATARRRSATR